MSVTPGRPPTSPRPSTPLPLWNRDSVIAVLAVAGIAAHLATRALTAPPLAQALPLAVVFGADLLAGVSILTSVVLGEHLAGALVVLMLSGGEALEHYVAVWRQAPDATLLSRVMARRNDASDATADVVRQQLGHVAPPDDWVRLAATGPVEATFALVRAAIVANGITAD